jgi:hypothetical protein
MKKIHESEIVQKRIDGKVGSVDVYDVIDENIQSGIRIVKSNSDVPRRQNPRQAYHLQNWISILE